MQRRTRTRLFILVFMFLLLTGYTIHWLRLAGITLDFGIYFTAAQQALRGESAYLPYAIGESFVYHPAVLTMMSALAWLPLTLAFVLWSLLSFAAYAFSIYLIFTQFAPERRRNIWISVFLLLCSAPFVENLYIGQINAFVTLLLVLCLLFDERDRPLLAGLCLGVAILLKTSPAILLVYFLALRRYRVIIATVPTLAAFSLLAFIQFGSQVYSDFFSVLGYIAGGRVVLSDYFNPSAAAVTYRILSAIGITLSGDLLSWVYRVVYGGLFLWLMWRAWRGAYRSPQARYWLYAAVLILMTLVSPLVWYHHNVFLLLPLALVLLYRFPVGVGIMLLMQLERLLYNFSVNAGRVSIEALPLALALSAGTATLIGQLWLLYIVIREGRAVS
jgi:alpha-1,2-mannosyltransferase